MKSICGGVGLTPQAWFSTYLSDKQETQKQTNTRTHKHTHTHTHTCLPKVGILVEDEEMKSVCGGVGSTPQTYLSNPSDKQETQNTHTHTHAHTHTQTHTHTCSPEIRILVEDEECLWRGRVNAPGLVQNQSQREAGAIWFGQGRLQEWRERERET
jgi:hypothetical protein